MASHPKSRFRGLGSAREGAREWWAMRLSSVALVPLALWWVIAILVHAGAGYAEFVDWVRMPVTAILLLVTLPVLFHHIALGVKTVIEDYVHHEALKLAALALTRFATVLLAVAGLFAVLRIALGA